MLRRYAKTDAPAWQRKLVAVAGALFGATMLLFAAWAIVLFLEDPAGEDCEELGWNVDYQPGECD